jgi:hypothetical protein
MIVAVMLQSKLLHTTSLVVGFLVQFVVSFTTPSRLTNIFSRLRGISCRDKQKNTATTFPSSRIATAESIPRSLTFKVYEQPIAGVEPFHTCLGHFIIDSSAAVN